MTAADTASPSSSTSIARSPTAMFVATFALSAFLLFSVQPIFAKMLAFRTKPLVRPEALAAAQIALTAFAIVGLRAPPRAR